MSFTVKVGFAVLCAAAILGFAASPRANADICGDLTPPVDTNGTFQTACGISLGTAYTGEHFGITDAADVYATNVTGPARVTATVQDTSAPPRCTNAYIYDLSATLRASNANCGNGGQPGSQLVYDAPASGTIFLVLTQPGPIPPGPNRYTFQVSATGVPSIPTTLWVRPLSDSSVSVEWATSSTSQTGFDLELNGGTPRGVTSSPFTWTGLAPGTKACFRVRARNAVGTSGWYPSTTPSDICATTPDPGRNVAAASGGVQPGPPSAQPPPPPPLPTAALGPPPTGPAPAPIPPTPAPVPPGTTPPATPPTAPAPPAAPAPSTPPAPSAPSPSRPSARCVAARSTIRRFQARISADRARLRRATTNRARAVARRRLAADRRALARARRSAARVC